MDGRAQLATTEEAKNAPQADSRNDGALLSDVRVLELGNFIAAPFATRLLADFGAEVIKVETPGTGDELRTWRRQRGKVSMMFRTLARNKRSVTVDLRTEEGQEIVRDLVAKSDVVIENFRPGTLENWHLGEDDLKAVNSDIIMVRISGYGQTGPYRDRAGFGGVAEAFAGLRHVTGHADRAPVRPAAPIGDAMAGLYGALGAVIQLFALKNGHRVEQARVVDVALYEAVYSAMESLIPDYDAYGMVRERSGANLPGVVPSGSYPTADGQSVMIAGNAAKPFRALMQLCGRPDLADDATLADGHIRSQRETELDDIVRNWTLHRTVSEAVDELAAAGVPAGPVYDATGIAADEHFAARGMLESIDVSIEDDTTEAIRFPGVVPRIPGSEGHIRWVGPELGEHTESILTGVLGVSAEDYSDLKRKGVV
ncbi:CoA transferase [Brevibacterium aurantiacum]|uniref:CoA transferase n=1 Tax=Brevibacterium aurantiacum TaxID=273384 RepID=A0A556C9X4_BREAU|nr:CoA transferase [Brevibacterium aurantiacum]